MDSEVLTIAQTDLGPVELAVGHVYVADAHIALQSMHDLHQLSLGLPTRFAPPSAYDVTGDEAFMMHSNALTSTVAQLSVFGQPASESMVESLLYFATSAETLAGLESLFLSSTMGASGGSAELQQQAAQMWSRHGMATGNLDAGVEQMLLMNPSTSEFRVAGMDQLKDMTAQVRDGGPREGPFGVALSGIVSLLPKPVRDFVQGIRETPVGRFVENTAKVGVGIATGGLGLAAAFEGGVGIMREISGHGEPGGAHPPPAGTVAALDRGHFGEYKQMHEYLRSMKWIVEGATRDAVDTFGSHRPEPEAAAGDRKTPNPNICPPGDESYVGPPPGSHPKPMPIPQGRGLDHFAAEAFAEGNLGGCFPDELDPDTGQYVTPGPMFETYLENASTPLLLQNYVVDYDELGRTEARIGKGDRELEVVSGPREVRVFQRGAEVARALLPYGRMTVRSPDILSFQEAQAALLAELKRIGAL